MIPKIIHFCWYGNNEYSALVLRCLESWKKYHPDWRIMKWDETNSPMEHPFLSKAIKDKQYAFASDFTRVYALSVYGGVYFDTDIEVIKNFDELLNCDFFIGFENIDKSLLGTAIIGSVPKSEVLLEILNWYNLNNYYLANPKIITPIVNKFNDDLIKIKCLDYDFFYPYNIYDSDRPVKQLMYSDITKNTYGIHHWAYSWKPNIFLKVLRYFQRKLLGRN